MIGATGGCGRASQSEAGSVASLADLNRAVALYTMVHGRCPTNISELTNVSTLCGKTLPVPPPGKKLVIDTDTRQVVFIRESNQNENDH